MLKHFLHSDIISMFYKQQQKKRQRRRNAHETVLQSIANECRRDELQIHISKASKRHSLMDGHRSDITVSSALFISIPSRSYRRTSGMPAPWRMTMRMTSNALLLLLALSSHIGAAVGTKRHQTKETSTHNTWKKHEIKKREHMKIIWKRRRRKKSMKKKRSGSLITSKLISNIWSDRPAQATHKAVPFFCFSYWTVLFGNNCLFFSRSCIIKIKSILFVVYYCGVFRCREMGYLYLYDAKGDPKWIIVSLDDKFFWSQNWLGVEKIEEEVPAEKNNNYEMVNCFQYKLIV